MSLSNNMREVYQKKNILIEKATKRASQIRGKNDVIIKDVGSRLERWAKYFEGLLNADEPEETVDFSDYSVPEELNINMESPCRDELDKATGLLKRNKAPGIDNITPEILKDGGKAIREWVLRICQHIWQTEHTRQQTRGKVSFYHCQKGATFPTATTTEASLSLIFLARHSSPFYSR